MIKVGILGPTGYAGLELINILLRHPEAEIVYLGSRRDPQPLIAEIWPALRSRLDMRCLDMEPESLPDMDAAFLALPHTVAMDFAPMLLDKGARVVDLSADYRLKTPEAYARHYKTEHRNPERLGEAVFGLPERFRKDIAEAKLVANPGCYPTATILALAPLLAKGLVREDAAIVVDAKSGITGAGRNPSGKFHYPEMNENLWAYKVGTHQHTGEIGQNLDLIAGRPVKFCFVPHVVPMDRGILATCYAPLAKAASSDELTATYKDFFAGEPFVRVLGASEEPQTKHVSMTNYCDIAIKNVGGTAVVLSAIDNLVKGAAGQAVQNMNIMFGFEETAGLA